MTTIAAPSAVAAAPGAIDTSDYSAVVGAYVNTFLPTQTVPMGWTGSTATCTAGAVSADSRAATIKAINYFRSMAGVDPATEETDATERKNVQEAALMQHANGKLDHFPTTDWKCYTAAGALGSASQGGAFSSILAPRPGAQAIPMYVRDNGVGNEHVGHRRTILNRVGKTYASGSTSNYNAIRGMKTNASATDPGWQLWPTAGYFPVDLDPVDGGTGQSRWSIGRSGANFTNAKVTVKQGSTSVPVTIDKNELGAGSRDAVIVFRVPNVTKPAADAEVPYTVTITGVTGIPAAENGTKTYTVTMVNPAVKPTKAPAITGTPTIGQTLSVGGLTWSEPPASITYQWLRNGTAIEGATKATYTLAQVDAGASITVKVTGAKAAPWVSGSATSGAVTVTGAASALVAKTPVTVAGTPEVGQVLTATPAVWNVTPATVTRQWFRGATAIAGATGLKYTLTSADVTNTITVKESAVKAGLTSGTSTSAAIGPVKLPALTAKTAVSLPATAQVGKVMTVTAPTWNVAPGTVTYTWYAGTKNGTSWAGMPIPGATGLTYTPSSAYEGQYLMVAAKATKAGYQDGSSQSTLVGPVAKAPAALIVTTPVGIDGTATVGQNLNAIMPTWNVQPDSMSLEWLVNGNAVAGPPKPSYTLSSADLGKKISVRITATKAGYTSATTTSVQVGPVVAAPALKVKTAAAVTGIKTVGSTLGVKPPTWNVAPEKLTYQWFRGTTAITGATAATYTLTAADLNARIAVRVTGAKAGYTNASSKSALVGPVAKGKAVFSAYISYFVNYDPDHVYAKYQASTWCGSATYQWFRDGVAIPGDTDMAHTLVPADRSKTLTFKVTASGPGCITSSATSDSFRY